jgi:hypothetical protein
MDDWPATLYTDGRVWGMPRRLFTRHLRALFRRVPFGFCIGDLMASEYATRYGKAFHGFMNCVDDADFAPSIPSGNPGSLRWTYVGGLHLNRWKPLLALAASITRRGGRLDVFAPARDVAEHGVRFEGMEGVRLGSLAPSEVLGPMKGSDVLIHVESFDPGESVFTRLSVSTKLAQYLSCGKAVLGFGPGDLASMGVVRDSGAGLVVGSEDPAEVDAAVERLTLDGDLRAVCGARARAFASVHYKKSVVCERFRERLLQAAGPAGGARQ